MTVSDVVGFLYILYVCVLFVLVIVRSKKFMLLFSSISSVNFNLWCIAVSYTHLDVYKRQALFPAIGYLVFTINISSNVNSFTR